MPADQLPLDIRLREDATFANYIGEARRRLEGVRGIYLVCGDAGTGKSHLLQAACHAVRQAGGAALYAGNLTEHEPAFVEDLERFEAICLDDVDQVLGGRAWEEALFHLINSVRDRGDLLVMSGRGGPSRWPVVLADLKSRLLGAGFVETDALDDLSKQRLLQEKAARQGFEVTDEVARYILLRADRSPQGLIELLARIERETLRQQRRVTVPLVREVLGP